MLRVAVKWNLLYSSSLCWQFYNFQSWNALLLLHNSLLTELIFSHDDLDDELSELKNEAVPDDVRKWLASTFAKPEQVRKDDKEHSLTILCLKISKKSDEHPTLRSVANAIRTGIFIEKIYSRMSTSQLMVIPPEVEAYLRVSIDENIFQT